MAVNGAQAQQDDAQEAEDARRASAFRLHTDQLRLLQATQGGASELAAHEVQTVLRSWAKKWVWRLVIANLPAILIGFAVFMVVMVLLGSISDPSGIGKDIFGQQGIEDLTGQSLTPSSSSSTAKAATNTTNTNTSTDSSSSPSPDLGTGSRFAPVDMLPAP